MLELKNLSKNYNHIVLDNINYNFKQGKIYCIIGRNGSGKTTLFNCISKTINYTGTISYNGNVGFVKTEPCLPLFLTPREFIDFFITENPNKNFEKIDKYFDLLSFKKEDRDKLIKELSHGNKCKLEMLINILSDNKILLLDEPLVNLDVLVVEEIKQLLKSIKNNHIIIFSTHILDFAKELSDELILLNEGKLTKVDNTLEVVGALKNENT